MSIFNRVHKNVGSVAKVLGSAWLLMVVSMGNAVAQYGGNGAQINAPSIGQIARTTAQSAWGVNDLIETMAYVLGGVLVFIGIMKIKAYTDQPQQTPLWKGFVYILLGGLLIAYLTVQDSSTKTLFGSSNVQKARPYTGSVGLPTN